MPEPVPEPVDPDLPGPSPHDRTAASAPGVADRPRRPDAPTVVHERRRRQLAIVGVTAVGGVIGALSRYVLEQEFPAAPGHIPWVVFTINITGSALLGLLLVILVEQFPRGRLARSLLGTGIIGAYTTFSTFVVGAVTVARAGHVDAAALYVVLSVVVGLAAGAAGMAIGRLAMAVERWLQETA